MFKNLLITIFTILMLSTICFSQSIVRSKVQIKIVGQTETVSDTIWFAKGTEEIEGYFAVTLIPFVVDTISLGSVTSGDSLKFSYTTLDYHNINVTNYSSLNTNFTNIVDQNTWTEAISDTLSAVGTPMPKTTLTPKLCEGIVYTLDGVFDADTDSLAIAVILEVQ